jgi:hypothetical protein
MVPSALKENFMLRPCPQARRGSEFFPGEYYPLRPLTGCYALTGFCSTPARGRTRGTRNVWQQNNLHQSLLGVR